MQKTEEVYAGKAKTVYKTEDKQHLILHFRDDTSAYDGEKVEQLPQKGRVNNAFNSFIMQYLEDRGVKTHFVEKLTDTETLVKSLNMLPIECVVRNRASGGLCRRLGVAEGLKLSPALFEFFLKNDALHDPMVSESHITAFGWATSDEIELMKQKSHQVNAILQPLFQNAGMILVDFKLEFGRHDGELLLGDEFTPDNCRIWDEETGERLDKDRFRRDLGHVIESYQTVAERLGVTL